MSAILFFEISVLLIVMFKRDGNICCGGLLFEGFANFSCTSNFLRCRRSLMVCPNGGGAMVMHQYCKLVNHCHVCVSSRKPFVVLL